MLKALWGRVAKADAPEGTVLGRFKAHLASVGVQTNALAPDDAVLRQFNEHGALEPPLAFESLVALYFASNSLQPNIAAYKTNIDGFGWRPEPTIDFNAGNALELVKNLLTMRGGGTEPDQTTLEQTFATWKKEAAIERARMVHFFEYLNTEDTWTAIRQKMRQDYEILGNAACEIVRNAEGELALLNPVPFVTMRMLPLDDHAIEVEVPHKTDDVTIETTKIRKRFRRYVQIRDNLVVYFKELGDPRTFSSKSNIQYQSVEALQAAEPDVAPATEIWHLKQDAPNEAYGVPRWIGNLLSVLGSRSSEEVNYSYFENKSIPPMVLIAEGGRFAADGVKKIESFIENNIRGKQNFHKILILESEPDPAGKTAGRVKIVPLMSAQAQDALFQRYDQNNIDKVGAAFRMPGILRGQMKELNRATSEVALGFAEQQVFGPEREMFDAIVNRRIVPRLGIRFWKHKSIGPRVSDPAVMTEILNKLVTAGVLMPDEARDHAPEVLGRALARRDDKFLRQPLRLSLAEMRATGSLEPGGETKAEGDLTAAEVAGPPGSANGRPRRRSRRIEDLAAEICEIRAAVEARELEEETLRVPAGQFRQWLETEKPGAKTPTR